MTPSQWRHANPQTHEATHEGLLECLHQESQGITIGLGLFDQSRTQMISTDPCAKFTNLFGMQSNGLASNLVQSILSQHHLGTINGGRKDAKLGLVAHVQRRRRGATACGRGSVSGCSLRHDKGRATGCGTQRRGKGLARGRQKHKEGQEGFQGRHGCWLCYCNAKLAYRWQ